MLRETEEYRGLRRLGQLAFEFKLATFPVRRRSAVDCCLYKAARDTWTPRAG